MKVFVMNDHKILYASPSFKKPVLIGYIYEYEIDEEDTEYWNSLNTNDQEDLVDEAQKKRTDLRLLIRNKQLKILSS